MGKLKRLYKKLVPERVELMFRPVVHFVVVNLERLLFAICSLFPIKDKVALTCLYGTKYGDNPQYIAEELHKMNPSLDIIWLKDSEYSYEVPEWMRTVSAGDSLLRYIYECATAKAWVTSHRLEAFFVKRRNQIFIETWHGGLGLKKVDGDVEKFRKLDNMMREVKNTAKCADLFITNTDHLTGVYRSAFSYTGKVWKVGYPRNDVLINGSPTAKAKVHKAYGIPADTKILVYAPTFRDRAFSWDIFNIIDYNRLISELESLTGDKWVVLVRLHPVLLQVDSSGIAWSDKIINATAYPDVQEIILAADTFISDYSSCMFEAALREIPVLTFATDFEQFKAERPLYFDMEELPFPYATTNDQLMENIRNYNHEEVMKKWAAFMVRTGFYETGHAARDIAYVINEFVKGNREPLDSIVPEK